LPEEGVAAMAPSPTSFQQGQTSSFRRAAPVMGNRVLETQQRSSRTKSKTYPQKRSDSGGGVTGGGAGGGLSPTMSPRNGSNSSVQVAPLDERNLKRAVHRYGTMPKGARIGAYLESLR
jgi:abelson tyrosine-protein kinase 1